MTWRILLQLKDRKYITLHLKVSFFSLHDPLVRSYRLPVISHCCFHSVVTPTSISYFDMSYFPICSTRLPLSYLNLKNTLGICKNRMKLPFQIPNQKPSSLVSVNCNAPVVTEQCWCLAKVSRHLFTRLPVRLSVCLWSVVSETMLHSLLRVNCS